MLIDKLSNSGFIKGVDSVGITLNFYSDSEYDIDFVSLRKNKKIVNILDSKTNSKSIHDLTKVLSSKNPVSMSIMGKGIIHRKFESSIIENATDKEIINNIFPNTDQDEFLVQKSPVNDEVYISLIRKKIVEDIVNHFTSQGIFILSITIGPFALNGIISLIDDRSPNNLLLVKNQELTIKNDLIYQLNISQNTQDIVYKIGDDKISHENLVSFATALSFYLQNNPVSIDLQSIQTSKEEFIYKRIFYLLGWGILIFAFLVLLINYLLFDYYNNKYNDLSLEYSKRTEETSKLKLLSKQLADNERFVTENNLLETSRFSYYTDRLALIIPDNIVLNELYLNPLTSDLQKNKEIDVVNNLIIIKGVVNKNSLLNEWIKKIELEKWVEKVEILKFTQKDKSSGANFELEIVVKKSNN